MENQNFEITREEFILNSTIKHNHKYDYSVSIYTYRKPPIDIICPHHGRFKILPIKHMNGQGCKKCNLMDRKISHSRSTYIGSPAILYYIKTHGLWKIGITKSSVSSRFSKELRDSHEIEIIFEKYYLNGEEAWDEERRILTQYKKYKYYGENVLYSGKTEMFTRDILFNS